MILVNGEKLDTNGTNRHAVYYNKCVKELREKFPNFPKEGIRFTYVRDHYKKVPYFKGKDQPAGHKTESPAQMPILIEAQLHTDKGTDIWRYYTGTTVRGKRTVYLPEKRMSFNGNRVLGEMDIELIFFLIYVSPQCASSHKFKHANPNRRKEFFMVENKIEEAKEVATLEGLEAEAKLYVFSDKIGIAHNEDGEVVLRDLAKAHFIDNVDDLDLSQVRIQLFDVIKKQGKGKKDAYVAFIANAQAIMQNEQLTDEYSVRSSIQQAIDRNLIGLDKAGKHKWRYKEGGKWGRVICPVNPGYTTATESLYAYLTGDKKELEVLNKGLQLVLENYGS